MKSSLVLAAMAFVLCFLFTPSTASSQNAGGWCWTMEYLEHLKKLDPSLDAKMREQENVLQESLRDAAARGHSMAKTAQTIVIPVVVHVVYNTAAQNIPDQRVFDQIAITNRDYAGLNPHSMWSFPHSLKANTDVQFCLAQKKPDGSATNGIERRYTAKTMFTGDSVKYTSLEGLDAWDPTLYMNIWVCNTTGLCWGKFPGTGVNETYGVVMHHGYFGLIDTTLNMGSGGVNTHELGHCLDLRHIWADDGTACTGTDYAADTPNQAGPTAGYQSGLLTDACSPASPGIMYMNIMDYTSDRVTANFTPNQKTRMLACFASPSGPLLPLLASTACVPPTDCEVPTALKVSAITRSKATLSWTAMVNSNGYNIRYRKVGSSTWTTTTSVTNSKQLTGLTKNTYYEFQVQNNCSILSPYSASKVFQTLKTGAAKEGEGEEPVSPELFALYPNPAADQATLYYTMAEAGTLSISVTNTLGVEVDRLAPVYLQEAGTFMYQFPVAHLAPGVYFFRVTAGSTSETKRLTVHR